MTDEPEVTVPRQLHDGAKWVEYQKAYALLRPWVDQWVSDWYDPVMHPDIVDALRMILDLEPVDRSEDE